MHRSVRIRSSSCLAALSLALLGASLAGCYDPNNVSFDYIKGNLSPEMDGLSETSYDIQRSLAVNQDQTLRMFWRDLGVIWLMDQPSMLSPYYVISTNGQPR
ncbi:MAG: hypothetical protein KF724_06260 [Phycisphaeraceae bacterium]|nr:hypothetical protein [Phycisphaeraceae bacterium]